MGAESTVYAIINEDNAVMVDWQTWLLTAVAIVTIPVYIRILYVLIRNRTRHRFSSHFYTITISQGFIDIIGFTCYYTCVNMRSFDELKPFYWSLNGTFFVQWSYMQTYLFEYGRIIGVAMISIQRCSTVSFPNSQFNQMLLNLPSWVFFAFQYITPVLLCANMFFVDMYFNAESTLNVVIDRRVLEGHYLKSALIPLFAIIICSVAYGILIRTIRTNSVSTRRKDIRLSVQAVGLLFALVVTCIHFCMQFIFNYKGMTQLVYTMRYFTPLWVGLLTFINPWMILLMDREVRHLVLCRSRSDEHSSVHPMQATSRIMTTTFRKMQSSVLQWQNAHLSGTCDSRGVGGVGVLVNTSMAKNIDSFEQITTRIGRLRMRRCGPTPALTIFVAYAPTSSYEEEEEVEAFYMHLEKFYREDHAYYKVIIGDFNAKGERLSEFIMTTKTIHGNSQFQKPSSKSSIRDRTIASSEEDFPSQGAEKAAKFRERNPRTTINWDLFATLAGFWEDSAMDNIDEEYRPAR
ncbi:hypothetical protein RB195_008892 [Necator americanus]|uniref:G-protein coupled receptors family 1 profile domain-containing protein n=1 Tax=Necator americanus TaxID=51031 RepID=A0ABR1CQU9_NECAM